MPQKDSKFQSKGGKNGKSAPKNKGFGRSDKKHGDKKPYAGKGKPSGGKPGFKDRKPRSDRSDSYKSGKPDSRGGKPTGRSAGRPDGKPTGRPAGKFAPRGDNRRSDDRREGRRNDRNDRNDRNNRNDRPQRRDAPRTAPPARQEKPRAPRREGRLEMTEKRNFGAPSPFFLFGVHAVTEAILNPNRKVARLLVTDSGLKALRDTLAEARNKGLKRPEPIIVEKEDINGLLPKGAVHQGILLDAEPLEEVFLQDILIAAKDDEKVIILDQVTDPHNVGAILRSAAAFGAKAVIVQKLHAPDITGTLAKIACGAAEHVPLVREVNLSRALEALKKEGFYCVGLDERGEQTLSDATPKGQRVALVMGAEGDGLRRLVADTCDSLARLPTGGKIASLNVSNATAIALYELARE